MISSINLKIMSLETIPLSTKLNLCHIRNTGTNLFLNLPRE